MFDQTSDNLLEVFLLGRVPVPLAELDGREESGVVVIVLEKNERKLEDQQNGPDSDVADAISPMP